MIDTAKKIAEILKDEPLIVMFSTGKDSIVMSDLLVKHYKGRMEFVFLYFVQGLDFKQRIIDYYESRWNVKIHQQPSLQTLALKTGKKHKLSDIERGLRAKYDISYIAQGIRRNESVARRGQLAHLPYGIDEKYKKLYPIADLSAKDVMSYVKLNRMYLPVEYDHGFSRDLSVPTAETLVYLKHNFPNDYRKIIAEFPHLEAIAWAQTS